MSIHNSATSYQYSGSGKIIWAKTSAAGFEIMDIQIPESSIDHDSYSIAVLWLVSFPVEIEKMTLQGTKHKWNANVFKLWELVLLQKSFQKIK